jgi:ElaB/YqjD/DUF883 family membrane-anchored ribosome-binding protein
MNTSSKPYSPNPTSTSRASETIADTAHDAIDTVKTKVGDVLDRGQVAVSHASDAASHMAETATQQVKTFASELEAMTKRNPLGTIAGAVVVGVVIGLLTHGRSA